MRHTPGVAAAQTIQHCYFPDPTAAALCTSADQAHHGRPTIGLPQSLNAFSHRQRGTRALCNTGPLLESSPLCRIFQVQEAGPACPN